MIRTITIAMMAATTIFFTGYASAITWGEETIETTVSKDGTTVIKRTECNRNREHSPSMRCSSSVQTLDRQGREVPQKSAQQAAAPASTAFSVGPAPSSAQ